MYTLDPNIHQVYDAIKYTNSREYIECLEHKPVKVSHCYYVVLNSLCPKHSNMVYLFYCTPGEWVGPIYSFQLMIIVLLSPQ